MFTEQLSFPDLIRDLSDTGHQSIGFMGECWAAAALREAGYRVRQDNQRGGGDLTVIAPATGEIFQVEVKTARRGKDGRWQFLLYKESRTGRVKTDARHADYTILLAVMRTGDCVPYVVPRDVIGARRLVAISSYPSEYRGWLNAFRQPSRRITL